MFCSTVLLFHFLNVTQPERIQGAQYTVKSDVWSLGISLIELALGRFPFSESDPDDSDLSDLEGTLSPNSIAIRPKEKDKNVKKDRRKSRGVSLQGGGMMMSILELLQHIVNEPAPRLTPEGRFPKEAEDFVDSCLFKDPDARKTPKDLLVSDALFHNLLHTYLLSEETSLGRTSAGVYLRPRSMGKHILSRLVDRIFRCHPSCIPPYHLLHNRCRCTPLPHLVIVLFVLYSS